MRGTLSLLISIAILLSLTAIAAGYTYGPLGETPDTLLTYEMGWVDDDGGVVPGPIDRALLAKAKSHLKQAEIAQEIYALDNICYAADLNSLRAADPGLPDGITVSWSGCDGYRIEVAAHDSRGTVCSLDKVGGSAEYHATATEPGGG